MLAYVCTCAHLYSQCALVLQQVDNSQKISALLDLLYTIAVDLIFEKCISCLLGVRMFG